MRPVLFFSYFFPPCFFKEGQKGETKETGTRYIFIIITKSLNYGEIFRLWLFLAFAFPCFPFLSFSLFPPFEKQKRKKKKKTKKGTRQRYKIGDTS